MGTRVCSATDRDWRRLLSIPTVMSMPGSRRCLSFAKIALTVIVRDDGSMRVSMLSTVPLNVSPGKAAADARTAWPLAMPASWVSATEKSTFIREMSSSVVITSAGRTSAPTLTRRNPRTPANGVFMVRSAMRDRVAATRAAALSRVALAVSRLALVTKPLSRSFRVRWSVCSCSLSVASAAVMSADCSRDDISATT